MNEYFVTFYNRFACQTQSVKISACNKFRAGRKFYREYDRKKYYEVIESITEFR